jgi:hypothetical protein
MGSVIDLVPCPQCNNSAYIEYYCKTGEVYMRCAMCGYSYDFMAIKNRKSQSGEYKTTKDGKLIFRETERKGFGVAWLSRNKGSGDFICLTKPITPHLVNKFKKYLADQDTNPEKSFLTRWDDDTKIVITVVGKAFNPFEVEPANQADSNQFDESHPLQQID